MAADTVDIATFRSGKFTPVLPDDRQVNPGRYGAELAYWLCTVLAREGVVTSYPHNEDWGWYLDYESPTGDRFAVNCGNMDGTRDQWLLWLQRRGRKLFGRDKPPFDSAMALVDAIRKCLEAESEIRDLEWRFSSESGARG